MKDEYNNAVKSLDLFSGENGVMQGNNVSFAISNAMTSILNFHKMISIYFLLEFKLIKQEI